MKTEIKLRFMQEHEMSKEGHRHWSPKLRSKVHKKVFKYAGHATVPVSEICTKRKLGEFMYNNYWEGDFWIFGYSHGKTRTHVKLVPLCKVRLLISNDGRHKFTILRNTRLFRYRWFYKEGIGSDE